MFCLCRLAVLWSLPVAPRAREARAIDWDACLLCLRVGERDGLLGLRDVCVSPLPLFVLPGVLLCDNGLLDWCGVFRGILAGAVERNMDGCMTADTEG